MIQAQFPTGRAHAHTRTHTHTVFDMVTQLFSSRITSLKTHKTELSTPNTHHTHTHHTHTHTHTHSHSVCCWWAGVSLIITSPPLCCRAVMEEIWKLTAWMNPSFLCNRTELSCVHITVEVTQGSSLQPQWLFPVLNNQSAYEGQRLDGFNKCPKIHTKIQDTYLCQSPAVPIKTIMSHLLSLGNPSALEQHCLSWCGRLSAGVSWGSHQFHLIFINTTFSDTLLSCFYCGQALLFRSSVMPCDFWLGSTLFLCLFLVLSPLTPALLTLTLQCFSSL